MNPLHFSDLKILGTGSPAHFKYALDHPRTMTPAMRLGMLVDRILTGGRVPPTYPGAPPDPKSKTGERNMTRQGKAWKAWAASQAVDGNWTEDELPTKTESDEADEIARAVASNDLAMQYLTGRPQVALQWEVMGVVRATRGIDVVGPTWFTDLKVTANAKPDDRHLLRHAVDMQWHAQLADYREAARQNGLDVKGGAYLVTIESKPPYVATVLQASEAILVEGEKCIHLWMERYKQCRDANHWPGYSQCEVVWEPWEPRGIELTGFGDDEEEANDGT